MKLIIGLGNPGQAYVNSRHNLGFQCINLFARKQGIAFAKQQSKAKIGTGEILGQKVILAKPRTFMNLSGESVAPLMRFYKIDLADLLVIYDDIDLPLGKIRIREKGSAGGHNGMKSIIAHLGSQDFPRLRVGIGTIPTDDPSRPPQAARTPHYVLGHFTSGERTVVDEVCQRVDEAIGCIIIDGIITAMNKYNAE
ncbi:MAG: aminoacyl-tRNA hydrolase [Dehalococcoidia bacterium]|nr:aminoacyl-tRNA hydrolase [Dehalococcoidia bacterium]